MNLKPAAIRKAVKTLTPEVAAVLVAKAHAQSVRAKVDAIKEGVLSKREYFNERTGERILDPKLDNRMKSSTFRGYLRVLAKEYKSVGFNVPKDYCPALIAEDLQRQAEQALIDKAEPIFGIDLSDLLRNVGGRSGLENRQRYLDLLCSLACS